MKLDAGLRSTSTTHEDAAGLEAQGYEGLWATETGNDPFLLCLRAAEATSTATIGTAVAIAFGRTPLTLAQTAYDLAGYSDGRFVLGIGSQVRAHIERRYSMPWSHPAPRMREFILAMRAIWSAWQEGTKLSFAGDFYTHTLMSPFFSPQPHAFGPPPVYLAGVGEKMTEVAGEVADGFFVHPFTTARYFEQTTLPTLRRGRAAAGHDNLDGFVVNAMPLVAIGRDEVELAAARKGVKQQIAFYGSTPAYQAVLDAHDRGHLLDQLLPMSKAGQWEAMGELIDDELLDAFAVVGDPAAVARGVVERWGGAYDRITLYTPYAIDASTVLEVAEAVRSAS